MIQKINPQSLFTKKGRRRCTSIGKNISLEIETSYAGKLSVSGVISQISIHNKTGKINIIYDRPPLVPELEVSSDAYFSYDIEFNEASFYFVLQIESGPESPFPEIQENSGFYYVEDLSDAEHCEDTIKIFHKPFTIYGG